jgi:hypothetical protein
MLSSCEKPVELTDHEVFFKIGNEYAFRFDDITLYDSSTHIIYFKDAQSEFREFLQDRFAFFDKGDTIYSGIFNPGYSSHSRRTNNFSPPLTYGDHILRIELWIGPDTRNNPRFIEVLKNITCCTLIVGKVDLLRQDTSYSLQ